ncbi:MAG TPA: Wzz/FepE/Etk N-terminal domain-containing protein [Segeticoccus sp.]|uniref:Wzz/FepE/Etk N-terminal domain-containing protein n=1 Tax=Segeticoccus sp. TaxID=2706531 RepID=UPI002D7FA3CA|nr:Wzz/FepE/Etk N-terminal domain-containing protein [Segeticoccus sp.]HET8600727.1 Wzz/FepE/Etk N-terminal domain-containing protein [Segeticoccus sp.]
MEIIDYLRVARRRFWVLIGVPLIAAGVTLYLILSAPTQYTATSTVSAPALVGGSATNQYSGSQAVNQYVAQFQATAQSPGVRGATSDSTGVKRADIADGLTISQVGASSVMNLTFTSTDRHAPAAVLGALTDNTLKTLFDTQVSLAQGRVDAAKSALSSANSAIGDWRKKNGMVDPDRVYQGQLDNLNALKQVQAQRLSSGDSAAAAALSGAIATAKQHLPELAPLVTQYEQLTSDRTLAATSLGQAEQQLIDAKAQLAAADPAKVVTLSSVTKVDPVSTMWSTVLPVTGAAVFVAIALVAMLEMLSRSRSAARASQPEKKPSSGGPRPAASSTNGSTPANGSSGAKTAPSGSPVTTPANRATQPATSSSTTGASRRDATEPVVALPPRK